MKINTISLKFSIVFASFIFLFINHIYSQPANNSNIISWTFKWNNCFDYSHDGKFIALACDNDISLYEPTTQKEVMQLKGFKLWVNTLCFSPMDTLLAAGGKDKTIKIWKSRNGELYDSFEALSSEINTVCFSSDGSILGYGGNDKLIKLRDINSKKDLISLKVSTGRISALGFFSGSNFLLSGCYDNSLVVWDINNRKIMKILQTAGKSKKNNLKVVFSFNPDSTVLASSNEENSINFWDVKSWNKIKSFPYKTNIKCITFISNDKIAVGDEYGNVSIYDTRDMQSLASFDEHSMEVHSIHFNRENGILASGSLKEIKQFDLGALANEYVNKFIQKNSIDVDIIYNDNENGIVFSLNNFIKTFDLKTRKWLPAIKIDNKNPKIFSPDNFIIANISDDSVINTWDSRTGNKIVSFTGSSEKISFLSFLKGTKTIVFSGRDKKIRFWDLKNNKAGIILEGHKSNVNYLSVGPDQLKLASCSWGKDIKIWDLTTGKNIANLIGHSDWINSMSFNSDGSILASSGKDNIIKLWDMRSFKLLYSLQGHSQIINGFTISPDGKSLASIGRDNLVLLWDIQSGSQLKKFTGDFEFSDSPVFSPDGKLLACSNNLFDKPAKIKIWDISTGNESVIENAHDDRILKIFFNKTGRSIISAGKDKTIKIWDAGKLNLLATFVFMNENDWYIYTPDGNYDGSDLGIKSVNNLENPFILSAAKRNRIPGIFEKLLSE